MKAVALAILALSALPSQDEEAAEARRRAIDARERCALLLVGEVDGVESVGYVGSGKEYRLVIRVRNLPARFNARQKLGGDAVDGIRVIWNVSEPSSRPAVPAPKPAASEEAAPAPLRPTVAAPRPPEEAEPPGAECDIVREQMGLKPRRHPVGGGSWKSWIPCQIRQHSVLGPGGGHSYFYTAHRPGCPFLDDRISPIYRGSFLWPFELRASDSAWAEQVRQDLRAQFWRPPPMRPKPPPEAYPPVATK
jgi:hypothetical protein